ncbi:MAG TPA: nitroreductase/quinone reductase family protein [Acidimicrobiia bacterium]|nr:nitroreductase/quinone reductase family protein [Acidimicrobiia bacterium]
MPAVRRTPLMVAFWKLHRFIYRASDGRIGGQFGPGRQLLLTTTGRRSGEPRSVALTFITEGESLVVVATNAGEPDHPAWWLNLLANPRARVRVERREREVTAEEIPEPDRSRLYRRFIDEVDRSYAEYLARTERAIPVVRLRTIR